MEHAEDNQHDLMSRFYEYQYKPGHGIKEHIAEIKNLAHLLDDAGTPLSESQVVSKIVCTLPQGYGPFMSSWRRVPKINQTITVVTSDLLQEERSLAKWYPKNAEHKDVETPAVALPAQDNQERSKNKMVASKSLKNSYSKSRPNSQPWSNKTNKFKEKQIICGYCGYCGSQITMNMSVEPSSAMKGQNRKWLKLRK
jgi:5-methylcytosine-specific restriction endonuclease McrA